MLENTADLFTPTCADCGCACEGSVLAGVRVPLCVRCLAVVVCKAAGTPMMRAVQLDLDPEPFEVHRVAVVVEPERALAQTTNSGPSQPFGDSGLRCTKALDSGPLPLYRRPVPRMVSLTQDNGFPGNTLLGLTPDTEAAEPSSNLDRTDAIDALAGLLSPEDREGIRRYLAGEITRLPPGLKGRVKTDVGRASMYHLFGVPVDGWSVGYA